MIENKINGKKYVGLTTLADPEERWTRHLGRARGRVESRYYLHRAIAKYGEDSFGFRVLESGINGFRRLCQREVFYIQLLNTFGEQGYNLTVGGEGTLGHTGSTHSRKPVMKIDILTGGELRKYKSVAKAAKDNCLDHRRISGAARSVGGYSGGFAWVYEEDYPVFVFDSKRYSQHSSVLLLDKYSGSIVDEFEDTLQASEQLGISYDTVSRAIRNKLVSQNSIFVKKGDFRDPEYVFDMTEYFTSEAVVKISKSTNKVLGFYYNSVEAAEDVGLSSNSNIMGVINGKGKTAGGYRWIRYSDMDTPKQ